VAPRTLRSTPRDGTRGRPGAGAPPDQGGSSIDGSLASRVAARQALIDPQRGVLLATNALDETQLPPQKLLEGDQGQGHADRGVRFLNDPRFVAASRSLKKPERIMARLMVMTRCLLVYAALEYRMRHALKHHGATFPHQTGTPVQHPTARWVCPSVVGIHVRFIPRQWPVVLHLTEAHQQWRTRLGNPSERFYR
jgi:hypothetical protein